MALYCTHCNGRVDANRDSEEVGCKCPEPFVTLIRPSQYHPVAGCDHYGEDAPPTCECDPRCGCREADCRPRWEPNHNDRDFLRRMKIDPN